MQLFSPQLIIFGFNILLYWRTHFFSLVIHAVYCNFPDLLKIITWNKPGELKTTTYIQHKNKSLPPNYFILWERYPFKMKEEFHMHVLPVVMMCKSSYGNKQVVLRKYPLKYRKSSKLNLCDTNTDRLSYQYLNLITSRFSCL